MKLAFAEQMRTLDRRTIEEVGVPGVVLMENAGRGTVEAMNCRFGDLCGRTVAIFVGPGNNGGDGLVIARHLHQLGARPWVFMLVPPEKLGGDAGINCRIVQQLPISMSNLLEGDDFSEAEMVANHAFLVVDAIFGTGLTRKISGHFAEVIAMINRCGRPVIAVDIPSGLDSDRGQPLGVSVQAAMTVTYGLAKPGQVIFPGVELCGDLHVVDISIPPKVVDEEASQLELLDKSLVAPWIPVRSSTAHKGSFGHLLLVAGSQGKTGAAILAGQGALRSGAGLVTLCAPAGLNTVLESSLAEAMTVVTGSEWWFSEADQPVIGQAMQGKGALVLGPGLGMQDETAPLVEQLYRESEIPMVVDADGLNHLTGNTDLLSKAPGPRVLTPHPGEMARLQGKSSKEVQADRLGIASAFAVQHGVTLVLKGAATVIAGADGRIAINPTGNAGMAAGGMGDVLSGVIGSLLAQGVDPWQAACLGAYVHGLAADRLARNNEVRFGYLASEVASELPLAFQEILGG